MLAPDDPHPALHDRFVRSLRALGGTAPGEGPSIDGPAALLSFQWSLLGETGHRPDIDTAAPTGPDVVEYLPEAGFFCEPGPGAPAGARWKVRRSTVAQLRACDSGIDAESAPGAVERGNRFLAACVRHVLGSEPPTMAALFAAPVRSSA